MAEAYKKIALPMTKAQVLANTAKALPFDGSETSLPPRTIWGKQWKGQENLYDLIGSVAGQIDGNNASMLSYAEAVEKRVEVLEEISFGAHKKLILPDWEAYDGG